MTRRVWFLGALILLSESTASAIPYFARKYNVRCAHCHALPPMLNEFGQRFVANGYRLPELQRQTSALPEAFPVAVWASFRVDASQEREWAKGYPNRVEIISSDSLTPWLSYFVEWRTLSYQTTPSGRLLNRSGRFEDLFLVFSAPRKISFTVGQFRMINQWDVSRRLSLSEPLAFSASVPGPRSRTPRLSSLRAFSLAGRAPAVRATWRALPGAAESDGWYHEFTLPLSGEFSLSLGDEPGRTASFELEGRPKGFLYETYYRRALDSLGASLFVGHRRWLTNLTGTLHRGNHFLLATVGTAQFRSGLHDFRLSVGDNWVPRNWLAMGARLDHQSAARTHPAVLPHVNLNFPGRKYTFLLTFEQRLQKNNFGTAVEFGLVF